MSYKFQKGDAKLGGAIEASQLTGTLKPSSLADATTDDIAEGSSAQYYTDARARGAVSLTDNGGDGSMAYDSSTGVFTFTGPSAAEVRAHFSAGEMIDIVNGQVAIAPGDFSGSLRDAVGHSDADAAVRSHFSGGEMIDFSGGEFSINASAFTASSDVRFDAKLAAADSDDLSEGASNLYYTDARARAAVSVTDAGGDGSMAYDSSTGVLTYTGPSASEVRAHFSAGDAIGIASGVVAFTGSTDDVSEGSNLYFTDGRARAAVSVTDAGGDGSMAYDSSTGVFTYTGPSAAEVRAHFSAGDAIGIAGGVVAFTGSTDDVSEGSNLYFTDARARAAISGQDGLGYNNSTGVMSFTGSTDDVSEGSNLYYTDARSRAAVSVTDAGGDGSMAYDSSTGVLTYTGPSASEVRAHFSAGDAIAISSGQISVDSSIAGHGLNISSGVLSAQHSVKSIGITNASADYGMNFQSGGTISSTVTVTLPSIVSGAVGVAGDLGKVVMIKAAELSGAGKVTVACAGSSTIDGPTETSLDIESSGGAVTLMVVSQDGNGIWAII